MEDIFEALHYGHLVSENFIEILDFLITPKIILFLSIIGPAVFIYIYTDHWYELNYRFLKKLSLIALIVFFMYSIAVTILLLSLINRNTVCDPSQDPVLEVIYAVFIKLPLAILLSHWIIYSLTGAVAVLLAGNDPSIMDAKAVKRIVLSICLTVSLVILYGVIFIVSSDVFSYLIC